MQPRRDVPLAPRTTLRVGGSAKTLWDVTTEGELLDALRSSPDAILLGGGSNVLIADAGLEAPVIAIGTRGITRENDGDRVLVTAAAGEPWDDLVASSVDLGLSGIECLSGIPGLVGATPIQNVGAYGQEVKDTIVSVRVFDRLTGDLCELGASECHFRYRDSIFKSESPDRFAVLAVTFALSHAPPTVPAYRELTSAIAARGGDESLALLRRIVIDLRRAKSMVLDEDDIDSRSAGSFFTNALLDDAALESLRARLDDGMPELPTFEGGPGLTKVPAAWLIERAGFRRGHERGPARISTKHALALVNTGGAAASDIVALAREVQTGVNVRFGVWLSPEPVFLGFDRHPLAR